MNKEQKLHSNDELDVNNIPKCYLTFCKICGQSFDIRMLGQVLSHIHNDKIYFIKNGETIANQQLTKHIKTITKE